MNKSTRLIATAIKQIKPAQGDAVFLKGVRRGIELSAHALSDALAHEYPVFDRMAFLRSCGVPVQKPGKSDS
jgi:hypothetical protein